MREDFENPQDPSPKESSTEVQCLEELNQQLNLWRFIIDFLLPMVFYAPNQLFFFIVFASSENEQVQIFSKIFLESSKILLLDTSTLQNLIGENGG